MFNLSQSNVDLFELLGYYDQNEAIFLKFVWLEACVLAI